MDDDHRRNVALDRVRMKRAIPIDPLEDSSTAPGSGDPEDWSEMGESRTDVRSALTGLSPNLARSVVLAGAVAMTETEVSR
jgi:DNA-directed RNA polymerase specialized sigma24 family protein